MTITSLKITNFQSHKSLLIDFGPHITTIIGPSDVGKSAIIRALGWVCLNTPSGAAFIRHGEKEAKVTLVVDGHVITRTRRSDVNTYSLDEQTFAAFGADVPDTIAALLNVGKDNFQGQHDAPYWLADTAGMVSRQLNAIVDLGVIDDALSALVSRVNAAKAAAAVAVERLSQAKRQRDAYAAAADADNALQEVEHLHQAAEEANMRRQRLVQWVAKYRMLATALSKAAHAATLGAAACHAWKLAATAAKRSAALCTALAAVQRAATVKPPPPMDAVTDAHTHALTAVQTSRAMHVMLTAAQAKQTQYNVAREALDKAMARLHTFKAGGCPICGGDF